MNRASRGPLSTFDLKGMEDGLKSYVMLRWPRVNILFDFQTIINDFAVVGNTSAT